MKKNQDGGPAFAAAAHELGAGLQWQDGMSLRDYFAAKAMQSMYAGPGARMVADRDETYDETNWSQVVARNAYEMADAMILQRENVPQETATQLLGEIHAVIGHAEWGSPQEAEQLLKEFIDTYHPKIHEAGKSGKVKL